MSQGGELHLSNLGQRELLRGMMERGVPLRTTVRGFSMHPFIRDQDVLTIAPLKNHRLCIGDIVAFIQPDTGRMAVHRVIAKKSDRWVMRGDNCPEADGAVVKDDIIGHVIHIERNGRNIRLGVIIAQHWIARLNRGEGLVKLKKLWNLPRRGAHFFLRNLQSLAHYRQFARWLALRVVISVAEEGDMEEVHMLLNPSTPYRHSPPNPNVINWIAWRKQKVIGFVQLVNHPPAHHPWTGAWLFSLHVHPPYRAFGIGDRLTLNVIEKAKAQGASELLLAVYQDNIRAVRLYEKLGFCKIILPALEPSLQMEEEKTGRRRIVMSKIL